MKTPCVYCNKRSAGCHSSCDLYKEFKDVLTKIAKMKEDYYASFPTSKLKNFPQR